MFIFENEHDIHTRTIKKEDPYRQPKLAGHIPLLCSKIISMFLTFPNKSVHAEVIGERTNQGGGYGLDIPVLHHFYGHKKGVNWIKN